MSDVIDLADRRAPVCFSIDFEVRWDGSMVFGVNDVAFEPRSMRSVADALLRAACCIEQQAAKEEGNWHDPDSNPS